MNCAPPVGVRVQRLVGCHLRGVVIPHILLSECNDGTYRDAMADEVFVSVRWDDKSKGYENIKWLVTIQ